MSRSRGGVPELPTRGEVRRQFPKGGMTSGFTLLELMIVVFLIALALAIGLPSFNALTYAKLRKASVRLAGTIRFLYSQAAIKSKCMRLTFDLKRHSYKVEIAMDGWCLIDRKQKTAFEAKREEEKREKKRKEEEKRAESQVQLQPQSFLNNWWQGEQKVELKLKRTTFQEVSGKILKSRRLPEGVEFDGIFVEHQREIYSAKDGPRYAYLHCFPLGRCERAVIYLKDRRGKIFSLEVKPLTGRVVIHPEKLKLSERFIDRKRGDDDYSP